MDARRRGVLPRRARRSRRRRPARALGLARLEPRPRRVALLPKRPRARATSSTGPAPAWRRRCTRLSKRVRKASKKGHISRQPICAPRRTPPPSSCRTRPRRCPKPRGTARSAPRSAGRRRAPRCRGCGSARPGCTRSTSTRSARIDQIPDAIAVALIDEVTTTLHSRDDCPGVVLRATDTSRDWTMGARPMAPSR